MAMSTKGPLVSAAGFDSIGRGKGGKSSGGGGGSNQDKIKIGIAAGLLVVAGAMLAWHFGVLDSAPTVAPPSAEAVAQHAEREREIQREIKAGTVAPSGSD
jgi:hypothetical protein